MITSSDPYFHGCISSYSFHISILVLVFRIFVFYHVHVCFRVYGGYRLAYFRNAKYEKRNVKNRTHLYTIRHSSWTDVHILAALRSSSAHLEELFKLNFLQLCVVVPWFFLYFLFFTVLAVFLPFLFYWNLCFCHLTEKVVFR